MKKLLRFFIFLLVTLTFIIACLMWRYTDNTSLQTTTYQISCDKIPSEFNGFRIAQIADLHNTEFGEHNENLISLLKDTHPDIIVFTGDQLDARKTDHDLVLALMKQAVQIAPCYLVSGNHEGSIPFYSQFETDLRLQGITILKDEARQLERNGAVIDLIGLDDATVNKRYYQDGAKVALEASLKELERDKDRYSILLAHRPEYFYVYERNGIDLALCGHVHGGQIRIHDTGLVGPAKEFFPEYDAGTYIIDEATMVVSRGLGNSIFPWRINNPPELVIIDLAATA